MTKKIFNYKAILFIIFIAGFLLRYYFFRNFFEFFADEGLGLLVSRHIVKYGEFVLLGSNSAGIENFFYGPYYYYLLAFLTFIFDNTYFIVLTSILGHTFQIILVFFIGKNFINTRSGIIVSLLYSLSNCMITTSSFWGTFSSYHFFVLSLLFFSLYYKNRLKKYLFLHVIFITLSFMIEYSVALIILIFIFWTYALNLNKNNNKLSLFIKIFLLYILPLITTFIPHIIYLGTKIFSFNLVMDINSISLISRFLFLLNDSISFIFIRNTILMVIYIYVFLLFILIIKLNKNKEDLSFSKLFIMFIPIICLTLASLKPNVQVYHLLYLYIFLLLSISIIIDKIAKKSNILLIILLFPIILNVLPNDGLFNKNGESQFTQVYKTTLSIKKTITNISIKNLNDINIIQTSGFSNPKFFLAPEFYYFLEKLLNKKIVTINQTSYGGYTENTNAKYIFLICKYEHSHYDVCLLDFNNNFGVKYKYVKTFYDSLAIRGYLFTKVSD